MKQSAIVAAAIKLADGRVFTGPTHAQAYWAADDAGVDHASAVPGYVDAAGDWVEYTAPHLARRAQTDES